MNTKTIKKYLPLAAIAAGCLYVINKGHVVSGVGGEFSNNKKYNAYLTGIKEQLLTIHDTPEESIEEVRHYMEGFPDEVDFNLAQYGNLLIYYDDVRDFMRECGYAESTISKMSDHQIWEAYKRNVGHVARELVPGHWSYNRGRVSYIID